MSALRKGAGKRRDARRARDRCRIAAAFRVRHDNGVLDRRQSCEHFFHARQKIDAFAAVNIVVGGEENDRRDLAEAVDHALHAEIR